MTINDWKEPNPYAGILDAICTGSTAYSKAFVKPTTTNTTIKNIITAIENVIHNDPATIVFWADGTKTVVKCQPGDAYDPEKGLAMAISKKALGNQGNYCNTFKKWMPDPEPIYPNIPFEPRDPKTIMESFVEYLDRNFGKKNETSDT